MNKDEIINKVINLPNKYILDFNTNEDMKEYFLKNGIKLEASQGDEASDVLYEVFENYSVPDHFFNTEKHIPVILNSNGYVWVDLHFGEDGYFSLDEGAEYDSDFNSTHSYQYTYYIELDTSEMKLLDAFLKDLGVYYKDVG